MQCFEVKFSFHLAIDVTHDHLPAKIGERALAIRESASAYQIHRQIDAASSRCIQGLRGKP